MICMIHLIWLPELGNLYIFFRPHHPQVALTPPVMLWRLSPPPVSSASSSAEEGLPCARAAACLPPRHGRGAGLSAGSGDERTPPSPFQERLHPCSGDCESNRLRFVLLSRFLPQSPLDERVSFFVFGNGTGSGTAARRT